MLTTYWNSPTQIWLSGFYGEAYSSLSLVNDFTDDILPFHKDCIANTDILLPKYSIHTPRFANIYRE